MLHLIAAALRVAVAGLDIGQANHKFLDVRIDVRPIIKESLMIAINRHLGVSLAVLFLSASMSRGDLTINVTQGANNLGQIQLHIGTDNFTATGNEGIGQAAMAGEQSGYYTPNGKTLADMAMLSGEDHFNWLQIVKVQPAGQNAIFGPVPHADPSNAPTNPQPRDNQPWYLNESAAGRTPNPPHQSALRSSATHRFTAAVPGFPLRWLRFE